MGVESWMDWNPFMNSGSKAMWRYLTERPKTRDQYYTQAFVSGFSPGASGLYSYRDNTQRMDDYISNRGLDYGDILYPSSTNGWYGGAGLGYSLRSVSRNVENLYTTYHTKSRKRR